MAEKTKKLSGLFRIPKAAGMNRKTKIIVAIGLLAMLLIFLTEILPDSEETNADPTAAYSSADTQAYKKQIEKELTEILERIDGVGSVSVLATVEGTTEYIYAEEEDRSSSVESGKTDESYQNSIVLIEENGEKKALVRKIIQPKVSGVVVVCEGGDDVRISEQIYKAVSAALGISYAKICVAKG